MDPLGEELRRLAAETTGSRLHAPYPVDEAMIVHWQRALGDANPRYTGADAVAPPAMLGVWTMDAPREDGGPRDRVLRRLEEEGFTSVVATDYGHEYLRELRPGDRISEERSVEAVSDRKETALGTGYFVTCRYDYRDAEGELVGVARMRLLKFAPRQRQPRDGERTAPDRARPRPAVNRDTTHFWEGVAAGELRIQRCTGCATLRHPPAPMCGRCGSTGWDTVAARGRGTVHSYVVHHHPPLPGIDLPHTVVLVELDEGVRLVSHLARGVDGVAIGDRVAFVSEEVEAGLTLPLVRPLRAEGVPVSGATQERRETEVYP